MPDEKDILTKFKKGEGKLLSKGTIDAGRPAGTGSPVPDEVMQKFKNGEYKQVSKLDVTDDNKAVSRRPYPLTMQTATSGLSAEQVNQNLKHIQDNFPEYIGNTKASPAEVAGALTKYDADAGRNHVRRELQANSEYLQKDVAEMFERQPDFIKSEMTRLGMSKDKVAEKLTNPAGDVQALKAYSQNRFTDLQEQYENEKAALDPKLGKPVGYTFTEEDQAQYEQNLAQLDGKFQSKVKELNNATFNLAAQKITNEQIAKGVKPEHLNPYEIGEGVRKVLGDENEMKVAADQWRRYGKFDPKQKVDTEIEGYKAMQVAQMAAFADGNTALAAALHDKTKDYQRKVIDNNPEFKKQQLVALLSDDIYDSQNSLFKSITGYRPTQEDIVQAGKKLGISDQDLETIKPDDIYRVPDALSRIGKTFVRDFVGSPSEFAFRHIVAPAHRAISPETAPTEGQINAALPEDWYDNSNVGLFLGGKAPGASQLIGSGSRVENDSSSPNYLLNVSDDKKDWNVNTGSIANALYDGIGQIGAFALGGGALGGALKAGKLVQGAELADRLGLGMYTYLTGYDRNKKAANDAIGEGQGSEVQKVMLANVYTLAEALSEQILPDTKIAKQIFSSSSAGREFVDLVRREGVEAVTKEGLASTFVRGAKEVLGNDLKEGAEEAITVAGNALGDAIFAPNQYEKTDYKKQALQQGVMGAISASIPVGAGAISNVRKQGSMMKSLMYEVGQNPESFIQQVEADLGSGTITRKQANEKVAAIKKLAGAVNNVPEVSVINDATLTGTQKNDYAANLYQESVLQEEMDNTKDPVQKTVMEEQVKTLRNERLQLMQEAGMPIPANPDPNTVDGFVVAENDDAPQEIAATSTQENPYPQLQWDDEESANTTQQTAPPVVAPPAANSAPVESFETSKGSVYNYLPDGRTQRMKTAANELNEPQDLIAFVKFKDAQQEQEFLEGVQRADSGTKVYLIDELGNKYNTNEQARGKDVKLALVNSETGKAISLAETSLTPQVGYNTFDQRRFNQDGSAMREVHIGNKVSNIKYAPEVKEDTETSDKSEVKENSNILQPVNYTTANGNQTVSFKNGTLSVINNKTKKEASRPTYVKALAEAASKYDFSKGEPAPDVADINNVEEYVAENSNSPKELVDLYVNQEPEGAGLSSIEAAIVDFGGFTTTNSSYKRFGDKNNMTRGKAASYLNESTGAGIDQIAQEITNTTGVQVETQDIVDFIDRFPNGFGQATKTKPTAIADKASARFQQLTGFPLTPSIIEEVYRQQDAKADFIEKQFISNEYENRDELEQQFWSDLAAQIIADEPEESILQFLEQAGESPDTANEGEEANTSGAAGSSEEAGQRAGEATRGGPARNDIAEVDPGVNESIIINEADGVMHIPSQDDTPAESVVLDEYHQAIADYNKYNTFIQVKERVLEKLVAEGKEKTEAYQRAYSAWRTYKNKLSSAEKIVEKGNRKSVKDKADSIRTYKLKAPASDGMLMSATPVAAAVKLVEVLGRNLYNAAVETVAQALEAGYNVKVAVQKGVDYVNDRWFTGWPESDFRDVMGENSLTPVTNTDVRALLDDNSGLSEKQRRNADVIVESVISNKQTMRTAIDYVRSLPMSDDIKGKLAAYIKGRINNDIFKLTGEEWVTQYLNQNGGDINAAIQNLQDDVQTMLLNAESLAERENIRSKEAAAKTMLQSMMVDKGITEGIIEPVYAKPQPKEGEDGSYQLPKRKRRDVFQENVQDKVARLQRAQEASTKPITTSNDAVTALRLKNSKAGYRLGQIQDWLGNNEYKKGSFFDRLKNAGIDLQQFALYLYAKHAPERNRYNAELREKIFEAKVYDLNQKIAQARSAREGVDAITDDALKQMGESIDPNAEEARLQKQLNDILAQKDPRFIKMPDGGSGMTNEQAKEIIDEVEKDGDTGKYETFSKEFRENIIDKLLDFKFDSGIVDEKTYNHLKSFYTSYVPLKIDLEEYDENGLLRKSGKNGKDLYRSKGSVENDYTKRNNVVLQSIEDIETAISSSENNGANVALANLVRANPNEAVWEIVPAKYNILKDKNGNILQSPEIERPEFGQPFYEEGKKSYVVLKDPGLQNVYKKVGSEKFNKIIQVPTRVLTAVNTLFNPNFILKNPLVDIQDAALSLRGQDSSKVLKNFRAYYRKAPKLVYQIFKGDKASNEWKPWIEEWKKNGGEISFLNDISPDKKSEKTLDLFDNYGKPLSKSQVKHYLNGLKRFASGLEQMTRVMAYRASREAGLPPEKSALISRNATVDFERKGVYGTYINAFKAFANAGIQGGTNIAHLATKSKRVRQFLGALVVGGIAETVFNDFVSQCDPPGNPDCYWEKPEWEKSKNFNVPLGIVGGKGILNMPAGRQFAWFKYLGNNLAEIGMGRKSVPKAMGDLIGSFADFYNPAGGSAPIEQQITGNASPITQFATNKNSLGNKILPENEKGLTDHENYFPSTEKEYVKIAEGLSTFTGGGKGEKGLIEISPNTIEFLAQTLGGGVYNFGFQGYTTAKNAATGESTEPKNIPFVNVFYRTPHMAKSKQEYYEMAEESKSVPFDHEKQLHLKEVLDRLVEAGEITPDQRGRRFNWIQRNQTALRKRNEVVEPDETPSDEQSGFSAPIVPPGEDGDTTVE